MQASCTPNVKVSTQIWRPINVVHLAITRQVVSCIAPLPLHKVGTYWVHLQVMTTSLMIFLFSLQIYWYRQGDVDPKFRKMIYFNSFTTILLCICANVYFHKRSWHQGTSQSLILHHLWTTTQKHTAQFVHSSEFVVTVHRLRPRH